MFPAQQLINSSHDNINRRGALLRDYQWNDECCEIAARVRRFITKAAPTHL